MKSAELISMILKFHREEDGPTAVEYAVMIALILGVCMSAVGVLSEKAGESFQDSADAIDAVL